MKNKQNTTMALLKQLGNRLVILTIITALSLGICLPLRAFASNECPEGMSQLDCDALVNGWENWVPDDGCSAQDTEASSEVTTSLTGKNSQQKAYNYFVENLDLSPAQASVIVGVIMEESGKNLSPTAVNPSSGAYGIAQWLGDRLYGLSQFATNNHTSRSDFGIQLAYMVKELNSSHKSTLTKLKQLTSNDKASINQAVYDFEATFEVSGHQRIPERQADAWYIFTTFGGGTVAATADSGETTADTAATNCDSTAVASTDCSVTAPVWGAQNGSGSEYSQAQLTALFGDPGTAASHPEIASKLVDVDFNGNSVRVHELAAGCLKAVANEIKTNNISYKITQMGCYRFDGNGVGQIGLRSYHTYGVACDINWNSNPYTKASYAPHDMPQAYVDAFKHHGFTWGGYWVSSKDYMHFEFNGLKP